MQVQFWKILNNKGAEFVLKKHVLSFFTAHDLFFVCVQTYEGQKPIKKHSPVLPETV